MTEFQVLVNDIEQPYLRLQYERDYYLDSQTSTIELPRIISVTAGQTLEIKRDGVTVWKGKVVNKRLRSRGMIIRGYDYLRKHHQLPAYSRTYNNIEPKTHIQDNLTNSDLTAGTLNTYGSGISMEYGSRDEAKLTRNKVYQEVAFVTGWEIYISPTGAVDFKSQCGSDLSSSIRFKMGESLLEWSEDLPYLSTDQFKVKRIVVIGKGLGDRMVYGIKNATGYTPPPFDEPEITINRKNLIDSATCVLAANALFADYENTVILGQINVIDLYQGKAYDVYDTINVVDDELGIDANVRIYHISKEHSAKEGEKTTISFCNLTKITCTGPLLIKAGEQFLREGGNQGSIYGKTQQRFAIATGLTIVQTSTGVTITNELTGLSINLQGAGITVQKGTTGVVINTESTMLTVNNNGTSVTVVNNYTGETVNLAGTGISISGNDTGLTIVVGSTGVTVVSNTTGLTVDTGPTNNTNVVNDTGVTNVSTDIDNDLILNTSLSSQVGIDNGGFTTIQTDTCGSEPLGFNLCLIIVRIVQGASGGYGHILVGFNAHGVGWFEECLYISNDLDDITITRLIPDNLSNDGVTISAKKDGAGTVYVRGSMEVYQYKTHSHTISDPDHGHTVTDPNHDHNTTEGSHPHSANDPNHNHSTNESDHNHNTTGDNHDHDITDPQHNHSTSDPQHAHGVTDPDHDHGITEPSAGTGHDHTNNDPTHQHGATDPQHDHDATDPQHLHTTDETSHIH